MYQYGQDATFDEFKEEVPYSSREALGVAGGIGFFIAMLNILAFTILASVMHWDTSGNAPSYSYDGAAQAAVPAAPVDGNKGGSGYGSIA